MSHIRFVHTESEALGIEYLSAVLKSGKHTVDLVFDSHNILGFQFKFAKKLFQYRKKLINTILHGRPDIVAFSVTCDNIDWAYSMAEEIKRHSHIPIVFGGIQASLIPETIISKHFIDFVIVGEGEFAFLDLIECLNDKSSHYDIKNLWFKNDGKLIGNPLRDLIDNLDILPFPDKELFSGVPLRYYPIITGRGCPYVCTYCCATVIKKMYKNNGRAMRRRSPENTIEELKIAKRKYNIKRVIFEDDLFTYNKQWIRVFSEAYSREIALPCLICAHPNLIDEEMVYLLKTMDCRVVEIGVQSLNEVIRRDILKRYYTNEHLKKALILIKENGICCVADNIVGLPQETEEDVLEMFRFYNELRPGKIDIFYLNYFPRLEIIEKSGLKPQLVEEINKGKLFASYVIDSGKNIANLNLKKINRIVLAVSLIYIFPKKLINFIIKNKLYRFLPFFKFKICYYINELLFYISSVFKKELRGHLARSTDYYKVKILINNFFNKKS